jgi:heme/copper-type cytochrome/quinol oxidase subunit 1
MHRRFGLAQHITSTDHKQIGYTYLVTSFAYFCFAGGLALVIRAQLFAPGLGVVDTQEQHNQLRGGPGRCSTRRSQDALLASLHRVPHDLPHPAPDRRHRMPRRYAAYPPEDNVTWIHQLSTVGGAILTTCMMPFFYNVYLTTRAAPVVTADDPRGGARSLEWATSCPPPRHNVTTMPGIRSEAPAWHLHHPHSDRQ